GGRPAVARRVTPRAAAQGCLALGGAASAAALASPRSHRPRRRPGARGAQPGWRGDGRRSPEVAAAAAAGLRVFGISDVHADWEENRALLEALPRGPFAEDALLVAGDVTHVQSTFLSTMRALRERFGHVFFVPGNHDLWLEGPSATDAVRCEDSLAKHRWLLAECDRLGVWTTPVRFEAERLTIVPLFSWYHAEFDTEPELPPGALPPALERRRRRLAELGDEVSCAWPDFLGAAPRERNRALAELLDAANDGGDGAGLPGTGLEGRPRARRGGQPVSFAEALQARERGEFVISFSHFLPRLSLLPEKRFLFFPQLARAAGSLPLGDRVARLKPALHLFGHTHFSWDSTHSDGVRFVQAPLGSPRERRARPRTMRLAGGVPALLWRGRGAAQPMPAEHAACWSDYYARHERQPASLDIGPWIRLPGRGRSRLPIDPGRTSPEPPGAGSAEASLWLVWGIAGEPEEAQLDMLSADERERAAAFHCDGARRRFVQMRSALRCAAAEALGTSPYELRFAYGRRGKPRFQQPALAQRCSFNVSHSGDVGVVLLLSRPWASPGPAPPVGVDVEGHAHRRFESLAERFFCPEELDALVRARSQEGSAQMRLFFEMWTKKEAWLKANGLGLSGGLNSLNCAGGAGGASAEEVEAFLSHTAGMADDSPPSLCPVTSRRRGRPRRWHHLRGALSAGPAAGCLQRRGRAAARFALAGGEPLRGGLGALPAEVAAAR
ncbi:unnamed protein product, partial [Prorocentrum cordatum]